MSFFPPFSVELKALSGDGNKSLTGSGSNEPLVIHNHLHMNEREIASIVTNVTAKVRNKRERRLVPNRVRQFSTHT
jgi:hypothetical protein